ncbi:TPA: hypothetical protein KKK57_004669 [Escherichia coli]|nr:hypothetical protein [Escherichia coli]
MLIDTSLLPDQDDAAPWDDSGGERKEKRPGGKDQGDEMESDNDTESNANIIAPDDGNINGNSGKNSSAVEEIRATKPIDHSIWGARSSARNPVAKATTEEPKDMWSEILEEKENEQATQSNPAVNQSDDRDEWVKKMSALSKQLRNKNSDDWKQHENVPPAGIQGEIKKSDSGIAVREGKEFRMRDDLVIESREITQPEATEHHETDEAEQSQSQQVDTRKNSEKWHHSYGKTDAAVVALMDAEVHGALFETVVMIAKFSRKLSNGDWVFNLSGEQFGKRLGCNQKAAAKRINDAVKAGFIEKIGNHCAGRTGATYRLKF